MIYHTHETPTTAKHPITSFVVDGGTSAPLSDLDLVLSLSILCQGRIIRPSDSSLLSYIGTLIIILVLEHLKQLLALQGLTPHLMELIGCRMMIQIIVGHLSYGSQYQNLLTAEICVLRIFRLASRIH